MLKQNLINARLDMVPCFLYYLVPGFVILYGIRKYRESKWGKCTNKVRLDGKIAVVTGSNCGIGFEVAKELLKRGAFVIFACRNTSAGFEAIKKIEKCLSEKVKAVCNFYTMLYFYMYIFLCFIHSFFCVIFFFYQLRSVMILQFER